VSDLDDISTTIANRAAPTPRKTTAGRVEKLTTSLQDVLRALVRESACLPYAVGL